MGGWGKTGGKTTNLYGLSTNRIGRLGGNIDERNRWMPLGAEEAEEEGGRGGKVGSKISTSQHSFLQAGCCEVEFLVNLESVSPKLESETTKMYFKLLSDILIYTNICTIPSI